MYTRRYASGSESDLREMGFERMNWILMVQDGAQWRRLSVSQKEAYSLELWYNF